MSDTHDTTDTELDALYEEARKNTTAYKFHELHEALARLGWAFIDEYTVLIKDPKFWLIAALYSAWFVAVMTWPGLLVVTVIVLTLWYLAYFHDSK